MVSKKSEYGKLNSGFDIYSCVPPFTNRDFTLLIFLFEYLEKIACIYCSFTLFVIRIQRLLEPMKPAVRGFDTA